MLVKEKEKRKEKCESRARLREGRGDRAGEERL